MWLGCGVYGAGGGGGCVLVPVLVCAWVSWGMGVGWLLRSGFPVCVLALRRLVAFGFRSAGLEGAGGGWLAAVVAWCLRGWSRLPGSAWVAWPDAGVRVGVFMAWAVWVVRTALLGAGRLVWAWLMLWCPGWAVVRVWFAWVGWGGVSGMCALKAWWAELGLCGRCSGWWRCW